MTQVSRTKKNSLRQAVLLAVLLPALPPVLLAANDGPLISVEPVSAGSSDLKKSILTEDQVSRLVARGRAFLNKGKLNNAQDVFEGLTKKAPGDAQGYYWLGQIFILRKQYDVGLSFLKRSVSMDPENMQLRITLGQAYLRTGRDEQALKVFEDLLSSQINDVNILISIGKYFSRVGRVEDAIQLYERVESLKKTQSSVNEARKQLRGLYAKQADQIERMVKQNADITNLELAGFIETGRKMYRVDALRDAQQVFEAVLARDPNHAQGYYWLGRVNMKRRQFDEGLTSIERSAALDPDNMRLRLDLGKAYKEAGRLDDAALALGQVASQSSSTQLVNDAQYQLGLVTGQQFSNANNDLAALSVYESMMAKAPNNASLVLLLGRVYVRLDQPEAADELFSRAVLLSPDDMQLRFDLAEIYERQGNDRGVEGQLKAVLDYETGGELRNKALDQLGLAAGLDHLKEKNYGAALQSFERVLRVVPDDDLTLLNYGLVLSKLERFDEAETVLQQIPELSLYYLDAQLRLGSIYVDLGREKQAVQVFEGVYQSDKRDRRGSQARELLKPLYVGLAKRLIKRVKGPEGKQKSVLAEVVKAARKLMDENELAAAGQVFGAVAARVPDNAQAHYWLGTVYMKLKQYDQGLSEIKTSVELAPGNRVLIFELGKAYKRAGRLDGAIETFQRVVDIASQPANLAKAQRHLDTVRGEKFLLEKNFSAALVLYKDMVAKSPKELDLLILLAQTHEKLGQSQEADAAFARAIELAPDNMKVRLALGKMYKSRDDRENMAAQFRFMLAHEKLGRYRGDVLNALGFSEGGKRMKSRDYTGAVEEFERVLSVVPDDELTLLNYGAALTNLERQGDAEAVYQRIPKSSAKYLDGQLQLSELYILMGREDEAIGTLEALEADEVREKDQERLTESLIRVRKKLISKGRAYLKKEDLDNAQRLFEILIGNDPDNAQGHYWLGQVYIKRQKYTEGLADVERSVELAPDNIKLRLSLGQAYQNAGQFARAEETYEEVIRLEPDNAVGYQRMAGIFETRGDPDSAREYVIKALKLAKTGGQRQAAMDQLGFAEGLRRMEAKEYKDALLAFDRVLTVVPEDPATNFKIAEAYQQLDRLADAEAAYLRVSQRSPLYLDGQLRLGSIYVEQKRADEAIQIYEAVIKREKRRRRGKEAREQLKPLYAELAASLVARIEGPEGAKKEVLGAVVKDGRKLLREEEFDDAKQVFTAVVARAPEYAPGHYWLGSVNLKLKESELGFEQIRRSIELAPDNLALQLLLAKAYEALDRYDEAENVYRTMIELAPEKSTPRLRLARIYERRGNLPGMVEQLEIVLANEKSGKLRDEALDRLGVAKGLAQIRSKDFDGALASFDNVLRVVPDDALTLLNRGLALSKLERFDDAETVLLKIPDDSRYYFDAQLRLGLILEQQGRNAAAIELYEGVVGRDKGRYGGEARNQLRPLYKDLASQWVKRVAGPEGRKKTIIDQGLEVGRRLFEQNSLYHAQQVLEAVEARAPNDASVHFYLGQLYIKRKDFDAGLFELERAVKLNAENIEWRFELGLAYEQAGRFEKAAELFEQVAASTGDAALKEKSLHRLGLARGRVYFEAKDYSAALLIYEKMLETAPDNTDLLLVLALLYERLEQSKSTDVMFQRILDVAPENMRLRLEYASVLEDRGDRDGMEKQLAMVLTHEERGRYRVEALNQLGLEEGTRLFEEKDFEAALEIFDAMLEVAVGDSLILLNRGAVLINLERFDDAEDAYLQVPEGSDEYLGTQLRLGALYNATGREDEAIAIYESLVAAGKGSSEGKQALDRLAKLYNARAKRLKQAGRGEIAISEYESLLEKDPDNAAVYFDLAVTLRSLTRYDEAVDAFKEVIRLRPENPSGYVNVAFLYETLTDYEASMEAYAQAISLEDKDKSQKDLANQLVFVLVRKYLADDDASAAFNELENLIERDPASERAHNFLGILYQQQDDQENAIKAYESVVLLNPDNVRARFTLAVLYERVDEYAQALEQYQQIIDSGQKNDTVERARERKVLTELTLSPFTASVAYRLNGGVVDYAGRNQLSRPFNSTLSVNLTPRYRPRKNILVSLNYSGSYSGFHDTGGDSLASTVGLSGNINLKDGFLDAGVSRVKSRSLLLEDLRGLTSSKYLSGTLRFKHTSRLLDLLKSLRKEAEKGVSRIERTTPVEPRPDIAFVYEEDNVLLVKGIEDLKTPDEEVRTHEVVSGDTLWGIAEILLDDPWLWPEIWYVNPDIENPHLIFPGDSISLVYIDGKPKLLLRRAGQLPEEDKKLLTVEEGLALYAEGIKQLKQGKPDEALHAFEKILEFVPDDPFTNLYAGLAYQLLGRDIEAETAYMKMLAHDPRNMLAQYKLGELYAGMDRLDDAITVFEKLILDERLQSLQAGSDVRDQRTIYLKAVEYMLKDIYYRKALQMASELAESQGDVDDVGAMVDQGRYLFEKGELTGAQLVFDALLTWYQERADAQFWMARVLLAKNRSIAALPHFELAVLLQPDNREYQRWLAQSYEGLGRFEEAESLYGRLLESAVDLGDVEKLRRSLGLVRASRLFDLQEYNVAHAEILVLRNKYPDDVDVLMLAGEIFEALGQRDKAIEIYKKVLELSPAHGRAHLHYASMYRQGNKEEEADKVLLTLLSLDPIEDIRSQALGRLGLSEGLLLLQRGKLSSALHIFEQLLVLVPGDPLVLLNIGIVYERQKKFDEAEAIFTQLIEDDPYNMTSHLRLGILFANTSRLEEAAKEFGIVLDAVPGTAQSLLAQERLNKIRRREDRKAKELEAGDPVSKTLQARLTSSDFVSAGVPFFETRSAGLNLSFTYPSQNWGILSARYGYTKTTNKHPFGADYAKGSHSYTLSVSKPLFPRKVSGLRFGLSLSRTYTGYLQNDSNALYALGRTEKRRIVQDSLNLNINYRLNNKLSLNGGYTYTDNAANLPVGLIFAPGGQVPVAFQGVTLGSYTSEYLNFGLNMQF